jgi:mannitol-1-phosphate/altronate dehydrogenase
VTGQKDINTIVNSSDDPPNADHVINVVSVQRDVVSHPPVHLHKKITFCDTLVDRILVKFSVDIPLFCLA